MTHLHFWVECKQCSSPALHQKTGYGVGPGKESPAHSTTKTQTHATCRVCREVNLIVYSEQCSPQSQHALPGGLQRVEKEALMDPAMPHGTEGALPGGWLAVKRFD
eukprot:519383-Pelagomonas_calceolata.AAC.4